MYHSARPRTHRVLYLCLSLAVCGLSPLSALGQPAPISFTDRIVTELRLQEVPEATETAVLEAYREAANQMQWKVPEELEVTMVQAFFVPEGQGTQIHVSGHQLGDESVFFIATQDPKIFQRMTRQNLIEYGGKTAFFPPGSLTVAVIQPKGAANQEVELERLRVLNHEPLQVFPLRQPMSLEELRAPHSLDTVQEEEGLLSLEIETLCDSDDRTRSDDRRVGRLMPVGCTGWLVGNDLALTAGHCDVSQLMEIIEFQIPSSSPTGTTNPAHPNDQYPVIRTAIRKQYTGIGDDWAVFKIGANSNTGKLPGVQQGGFFKLSKAARPSQARITGYGVDNTPVGTSGDRNSDNQTQQTEDGGGAVPATYHAATSQHGSYFRYNIDTMGGNSGSPVIDGSQKGVAVAIHTNGGCETGGNHGTAADNQDLRDAIAEFVGDLSTVYVDESEGPTPTLAEDQPEDYRKVKPKPSK
jgi:V8-like Glu-specific endopeptidase